MILLKITLENNKPIYEGKEVALTTIQFSILKGKGEGGHVLMRKENLKYVENDRKNNK